MKLAALAGMITPYYIALKLFVHFTTAPTDFFFQKKYKNINIKCLFNVQQTLSEVVLMSASGFFGVSLCDKQNPEATMLRQNICYNCCKVCSDLWVQPAACRCQVFVTQKVLIVLLFSQLINVL